MEDPRVEARNALSQPRRPSSRAHPRLFQLRRGVKAPEPTSPVRTLSPPSLALLCPWNCFPGRRREASTTRGPSSLGGTNSPAQLKCTPQRSPARRPASIVSLSRPRGGRRRCLPSPSPPPAPHHLPSELRPQPCWPAERLGPDWTRGVIPHSSLSLSFLLPSAPPPLLPCAPLLLPCLFLGFTSPQDSRGVGAQGQVAR